MTLRADQMLSDVAKCVPQLHSRLVLSDHQARDSIQVCFASIRV